MRPPASNQLQSAAVKAADSVKESIVIGIEKMPPRRRMQQYDQIDHPCERRSGYKRYNTATVAGNPAIAPAIGNCSEGSEEKQVGSDPAGCYQQGFPRVCTQSRMKLVYLIMFGRHDWLMINCLARHCRHA